MWGCKVLPLVSDGLNYSVQRRLDIDGIKMNDLKTWLQPKVVGIGWTPRTWEGWALIAAVIVVGALVGRLDP